MTKEDSDIPKFTLYGEGSASLDSSIQPVLELRSWSDVPEKERMTALQEISNRGWLQRDSEIIDTIFYLNDKYLRLCPGRNLHQTPEDPYSRRSDMDRRDAANKDFCRIFMDDDEPLVLTMLSKFAQLLISRSPLQLAIDADAPEEREETVEMAFEIFDRFANCLNHIFEQFAVNHVLTRNGFIPRQDETIEKELYKPTLQALSDPKWSPVNDTLAFMFEDFREGRFSETITKAHSAIHGFLQILVGVPGNNAKGELGKLIKTGKTTGVIPTNRFTEPFLSNIQSYITSERANNSTAKPSISIASSSDALLMMNMTLLFLQHCLQDNQKTK